ncbi:class F sortase [Saccharopolyspora sp. NFXS83]|uniref:class F sortase n=1 Tax=Saccharopolyspora sp. NFXS83 TaxID=2993560 RepID=UPI00224B9C56|nr:class F sortase [Saccharopolyspora sp. NFXS83]MCX2732137.1 class F sortase [Saccharopolyspora sp. NFXS83]
MIAQRRRLLTLVLAGVVGLVAVVAVVAGTLLRGGADQPPPAAAPPPAEPAPVQVADLPPQPVHVPAGQPPGTVRLPQGGQAELVRKEIDRSGTLPVPDGVGEATWWGAGLDSPKGATVLAGHVNWKGAVGPFEELWDSAPDQEVTVVDDDGTEWRYRVSEIVTLSKEELPARAADLFGQGGEHRLVLVTCGGRYVGGDLGYDENRIVVATPA